MSFAERAFIKKRQSDVVGASVLYGVALQYEAKAADLFKDDYTAEPTRSVLYRSAASLAMNCFNYEEAERLVKAALDGTPPIEIKEELVDIFGRLEIIKKIKHYNSDSFAQWFLCEFKNSIDNGLPNYLDENSANSISESLYVYNYLDHDMRLKYKDGLVQAFLLLEFNKSDISTIHKIINLSGIVKADLIIEPIIRKFTDGFMNYNDDNVGQFIFDSILEIIVNLSSVENGCSQINKLIESPYFKTHYALKTFIALSRINPGDFHNHLFVLRECFYDMQSDVDFEDKANAVVNAFLQCIKKRIDIIAQNLQYLKLYNVPESVSECNDYWFFKCLFVGERSLFTVDNVEDSYVIKKRAIGAVMYEIKTVDPLNSRDCVRKYMGFTKFLEAHIEEKRIIGDNIKGFPELAAILKKNKISIICPVDCL